MTALEQLGDDTAVIDADGKLRRWRMTRVGDIVLVDLPADDSSPRCINCYVVEVEPFDAIDGKKFAFDPQRLVYTLRWKHNAQSPDFELMLMQTEPRQWVNAANPTPLAELRRRAPHAIEWAGMRDVIPALDAFEAARESMARHH